jgi:hypothetical protein
MIPRLRSGIRPLQPDENECLVHLTLYLMFLLCFLLEKNEPGASGEIQVH